MNIPMSWLKKYVDIDVSTHDFTEDITLSGSKVESVENIGEEIKNVVVGKITEIRKHPDADKLVVCIVDIGAESPVQIVTGAKNVFEGAYVPVALDGATLAGGLKIKTGELRGQISQGMLCSIEELGSNRQEYPEALEDGIYIFAAEHKLGTDACDILELRDEVVEFEITSNRPDCYSVIGIAREAAATYGKKLNFPDIKVKEEAPGDINSLISVEILNPELCPRYIARVVKNVKIGPAPQWMRRRLTASGIRPINNIVDITNYVMLELGQPMHAFDIDNIAERKIIVRNAKEGEIFTTLDGVSRRLSSEMAVIADCEKAVAIAGVMGGENSKVTGEASAILFESATFNGMNIRLTSKKLGLRTDASSKYEKGLDPHLALIAVNRAVQLVEELGCGEVVKGYVDCFPVPRDKRQIPYNPKYINGLLGTDISSEDMVGLLKRVEIETVTGSDGNPIAIVPTFRSDVEIQADLSEEIARLYGYDNIPSTLSSGTPTVGKMSYKQQLDELCRYVMTSIGFCEAMTYSFESPKVFDKLRLESDNPLRNTVKILNPLGEDYSIMRTQSVGTMLTSLSTNYNRRNPEAKLFEIANVYVPKALPLTELPDEILTLTVGMYGGTDFSDISGVVTSLMERLGICDYEFKPCSDTSYMHPGRTAKIIIGGEEAGILGELHPLVADNYEIGSRAYIATLNLNILYKLADLQRIYSPLARFPGITRDVSLLVKEQITARSIENVIRASAGEFLEEIQLFDLYTGSQVGAGYKSLAYKISFRAPDRSLKDEEAAGFMSNIVAALKNDLDITLRS